jgi:predicted dehydrogenase
MTRTNKPAIYPKVDDEATIVLQYPAAQVIIQPSWNWPFSRKDMEVYGASGLLITSSPRNYRVRFGDMKQDREETAQTLQAPEDDVIHYITSVVRGRRKPDGLTGLQNNLIVTEILQAARESAQTGRSITLKP